MSNEANVLAALGKRDLNGSWEVKPAPYKSELRQEFARNAASGVAKVKIRIRPALETTEPQHSARLCCMAEYNKIRTEGYLEVVIDRVQRPREDFYRSQVLRFEIGKIYEVPYSVAAIALQHEPYCFLFEVALDAPKETDKYKDTSADDFAILLAEIKSLRTKVNALESAKVEPEINSEPEPKAETKAETKRPTK